MGTVQVAQRSGSHPRIAPEPPAIADKVRYEEPPATLPSVQRRCPAPGTSATIPGLPVVRLRPFVMLVLKSRVQRLIALALSLLERYPRLVALFGFCSGLFSFMMVDRHREIGRAHV